MSEFVGFLEAVFSHFGEIKTRRMFGGYGIYYQSLMFGLVADEQLYLKVDEQNKALFEANDCHPFEYIKNNKVMKMSYYLSPEEIYYDPHNAQHIRLT